MYLFYIVKCLIVMEMYIYCYVNLYFKLIWFLDLFKMGFIVMLVCLVILEDSVVYFCKYLIK